MSSEYRRLLGQLRSQNLTSGLQKRLDVQARVAVASLGSKFGFVTPVEQYLISQDAWEQVRNLALNPVNVFCHPDMLVEEPFVSLYYRGISGLSLKEVQNQARSVVSWEVEPGNRRRKPRVRTDAAGPVAGLYNSVISSIIENTTDWTLENGYRNIIASLGITFDGSMRNTIGRLPERRIRRLLLRYVFENEMLTSPAYSIDPAGALERLGAADKSAQAAIEVNPRCKNFRIAGVITPEMRRRLDQIRLFEKDFMLVELLSDEGRQSDFFDEVFNHTLRLTAVNE